MIKIDGFTITSYDSIYGFKDNKLKLALEDLRYFDITQREQDDKQTRGNAYVDSVKHNKEIFCKGESNILTRGLLETLVGSEFIPDEELVVKCVDTISVEDKTVTLNYSPVGKPGKEINGICLVDNKNRRILPKMEQVEDSGLLDESKFYYNKEDNTIEFGDDIPDGEVLSIFYDTYVDGISLTNKVYSYADTLELIVNVTVQNVYDEIYHGQIHIPIADFHGTFTMAGTTSALTQYFEFTTLGTQCGKDYKYWDFNVWK